MHKTYTQSMIENCLVMALIWGVGDTVDEAGHSLKIQIQTLTNTHTQAMIENCLVMALIWGVGGTVDEAGRTLFNKHFRNFMKGE